MYVSLSPPVYVFVCAFVCVVLGNDPDYQQNQAGGLKEVSL